jgi:hypothetical protein
MATNRWSIRSLAALTAAAALALGACGGDDDAETQVTDEGPQQLLITITGPTEIEAPATAEPGLAEITLANETGEDADAQLIRVEEQRSFEEVIEALAAARDGEPVPEWFIAAGGVGTLDPGAERSVSGLLEPGTHYVFNTVEVDLVEALEPAEAPTIEVEGEPSADELPPADATVRGFEYDFEAEGLVAGKSQLLFENTGDQPHHLILAPIDPGRTIDEVREFIETEEGAPPFDFAAATFTAVVGPGQSQIVGVDLDPGDYALICFISDREGSPPHALLGQVAEAEVAEG